MPKPKEYEPGKGGKRLNADLEEIDLKYLKEIKEYLKKNSEKIGIRRKLNDSDAVRAALKYMADDVEDKTLQ